MEALFLPSGQPTVCKWCCMNNAQVVFESQGVCQVCYEKAVLAQKKPELCDLCKSLFTDEQVTKDLLSETAFPYGGLSYIRPSAENGCTLCRIFLLQDPNPDPGRLPLSAMLYATSSEREAQSGAGWTDINSIYFSSEQDQYQLMMSVSAKSDNPAAKYISQRPLESNLATPTIFNQIQCWLHECGTTHNDGPDLNSPKYRMPTRVIDVGSAAEPHIKLFEPPPTLRDQYIALSYCWGRDPFLMTLTTNIDEHKKALDMSTLPQTFRDAVATTRGLGLRYIWIDALCIIQNSNEDKAKEIGVMGDIYSLATITITTVNASCVADGFLQPKSQVTAELPFKCPDGEMGSVLVSAQKTTDLWQQRLYQRAWCLQENLLSPRVLLFTDTEVIWQCQTFPFRRRDNKHVVYVNDNASFIASPFRRLPASVFSPASNANPPADLELDIQTWKSIVENYTRRRLTVASDRLPALAGVTEKFQQVLKDEYYAGLWKSQFIPLLAWSRTTRHPKDYFPPLESYRAPTWSWASIEGPIEYHTVTESDSAKHIQAKFISCTTEPVMPDLASLGEIKSGRLTLEVSMVPASKSPLAQAAATRTGTAEWDEQRKPLSGPPLSVFPTPELLDECYDMFLCEGQTFRGKQKNNLSLILQHVDGEADDVFERIGLYSGYVKGNWKPWAGVKRRVINII
ncbi:hypothetical protein G7Y89_g14920 [Cudoniella acicularis]|uniref:Heterokaryon incompatibility domain-containing protein n=1 Tax=Cudoniella acicularis TaxID=354080 RepID=A0A8H4QWY7_9HELO|nr:hypothetical protein G7Y89_g14920 [Cudoniella acicularis]